MRPTTLAGKVVLFTGALVAALSTGNASEHEPVSSDRLPSPPAGKRWHLVWSDEFDGSRLDESKWNRLGDAPRRDGRVVMNLHWDGYGKDTKHAGTKLAMPELTEGFHDYGLHWTPEEYVFYIDGKEVWRSREGGVSQVPQYLLLTEEIGKWGGDIATAELPDSFEVQFVRVYESRE